MFTDNKKRSVDGTPMRIFNDESRMKSCLSYEIGILFFDIFSELDSGYTYPPLASELEPLWHTSGLLRRTKALESHISKLQGIIHRKCAKYLGSVVKVKDGGCDRLASLISLDPNRRLDIVQNSLASQVIDADIRKDGMVTAASASAIPRGLRQRPYASGFMSMLGIAPNEGANKEGDLKGQTNPRPLKTRE